LTLSGCDNESWNMIFEMITDPLPKFQRDADMYNIAPKNYARLGFGRQNYQHRLTLIIFHNLGRM
jgi:hypothetical protein